METWELQLSRAWRNACNDGVDAAKFVAKAEELSSTFNQGACSSVFKTDLGNRFTEKNLPAKSDVLAFYNNVIKQRRTVLKDQIKDAAATAMANNSAEYVLLAACMAFFLRQRMDSFFFLMPGWQIKWTLLQSLRIENIHRMLDETTWSFIGFYRSAFFLTPTPDTLPDPLLPPLGV